ncbi:MAG: LOG family protein [Cyclobacteriaceae bacterium]
MYSSLGDSLFQEIESLQEYLHHNNSLKNCTLQLVDFKNHDIDWKKTIIENTVFLGCDFQKEEKSYLLEQGAIIFPKVTHLPYEPYRSSLYTWRELMEGYHPENDKSLDLKIYRYFTQFKVNPPVNEALYQRIHDHAIDDALRDFLNFQPDGLTQKRCVGVMGGHSTLRTDRFFHLVTRTAKQLAEKGYTIVSGGGPGIMEAANLGAYFAFQSDVDLREAIAMLEVAPHYSDPTYVSQAKKVIEKFPTGHTSLAIPTWFYGHEPSNLFASHIAKYFSNSIREDTLLAICLHGVIFAPGSAGTVQEIFMDAAQNHYASFNYVSPMIFLGRKWYEIESMIFPLVKKLSYGKRYHDLLFISDDPKRIVQFVANHKPVPNTENK